MPVKFEPSKYNSMRIKKRYYLHTGNYDAYVEAKKNMAKYFVQFPYSAFHQSCEEVRYSYFSKIGWNMLKTWFKEFFRAKTPEEKEMVKLREQIKAERGFSWKS